LYSDLIIEAHQQALLYPVASPGSETQNKVRGVLGWCERPEIPQGVRVERSWEQDGLTAQELTWSVGYGPRTQAWVFKPSNAVEPLPAVLALHDHGGFKYFGKEKIANGPQPAEQYIDRQRQHLYGGRAWVNALARQGFAVLVHDVFLWGSRKFPLDIMQTTLQIDVPDTARTQDWQDYGIPAQVSEYNYLARHHEHVVAKYLNLLGVDLAGIVSHEDRIALNYLRSRPDVQAEHIACMGLSGGGARACLLRATAEGLKAAVIVGMMSTYPGLLDHNVVCHTWMFFPLGWARHGDWPDLAACMAPAPLLVQYDLDDELYTLKGMRDAHARLEMHYASMGKPEAYLGQFYPGPHKFDLEMQDAAFEWLHDQLRSS
jgi:dienelactone hydrolase